MFNLLVIAGALISLPTIDSGGSNPTIAEITRRAEVIKPSAAELKWQRIPWVMDLAEGQRIAQSERRPIFLWVTGDNPLERC